MIVAEERCCLWGGYPGAGSGANAAESKAGGGIEPLGKFSGIRGISVVVKSLLNGSGVVGDMFHRLAGALVV